MKFGKMLKYFPDYQISNLGRVKSLKFGKDRILKQYKNNDGYFKIVLYKNRERKTKLVHRLVHETHIEKLKEGYDAHHINEDKEYNFVENLESKEHGKHSKDHNPIGKNNPNFGKFGEESRNHKLTEEQVIQIKLLLKEGILTQQEIADMFGVSRLTISDIKHRRSWSHIKYKGEINEKFE